MKSHNKDGRGNDRPLDKMPIRVMLAKAGLQEYYLFFEKAGYTMFDNEVHHTDMQIEQILFDVERECGIQFLPHIRVRLWKVLRHQWFKGPQHVHRHIEKTEIPRIFLPKREFTEIDHTERLGDIEPDRQRQIIRKTRPCQPDGRGPAFETLQFEVYRRQSDTWYEFKDLQRCVAEWEKKNPRAMFREDPREEVMKLRLRNVMDLANSELQVRTIRVKSQQMVARAISAAQWVMAVLSIISLWCAYYQYRDTPRQLMVAFIGGSHQFTAAAAFLTAHTVCCVVSGRLHGDLAAAKLQNIIFYSGRLVEQISDFRVETEAMRVATLEVQMSLQPQARGRKDVVRRRAKKKKDKSKDAALLLWAPKANKPEGSFELDTWKKGIEDSYKVFPQLEPDFRQPGGDRMMNFQDKLGGVDEDKLCVRVTKIRDELAPTFPEVPHAPSQATLGMVSLPPWDPLDIPVVRVLPPAPDLPAAPDSRPGSRRMSFNSADDNDSDPGIGSPETLSGTGALLRAAARALSPRPSPVPRLPVRPRVGTRVGQSDLPGFMEP